MYFSPFTLQAYYHDTPDEREERKTIRATCSVCRAPIEAWFAGISRESGEPYYRGECGRCGCVVRART